MDINWVVIKVVLIAGIAVIAMVIGPIWIMRRRARATHNPEIEAEYVCAGFKVATSSMHGGRVVSGTLHGTPFVLTAVPGREAAAGVSVISISSALGGSFAVSHEASRDLSGRDLVEFMFPEATAREAVRALFGLGFGTVVLRGGKLSASGYFKAGLPYPDALRTAVEQLAVLRATPDVRAVATWLAPESSSAWIMGVSSALVVAGVILFLSGLGWTQPFADGAAAMMDVWPAVAAACLALATLAIFLLRGRPLMRGEIALIILVALPGLCLGGWGVAMLANQHLDESAPRERYTQVEGSGGYHKRLGLPIVYFVPWRTSGGSARVPVSAATHNLQVGRRWIMRTRSGWLGYEWVESARPAPNN